MALLTANNIYKSYAAVGQAPTAVLRGVNFSCQAGELVALVGPSGAGKSTLLHILASLDVPDSGDVIFKENGKHLNYRLLKPGELARVRNTLVGMVFQFHHLLPEFTAQENVAMPLLIAGIGNQQAASRAAEMLYKVGMANRKHHMPSELSGGEQQRVAIARALVHKPQILFADEPTGNLDSDNAALITDLIIELQKSSGIACVVATHSADVALRTHRTVHIVDGQCQLTR
ncbi:MAG: ABC transporter ATP-binding protein [Ignavibacteria bacterium]|nr:ABC transporter ATP-binding protein [Ignavibacteria bacterium]